MWMSRAAWLLLALAAAAPAAADTFTVPPDGGQVVGRTFTVTARTQDTLLDIARRYGLGYNEITAANPGVDVWLPKEGTRVEVPRDYVLPNAPHEGLVLNIPEMRLYYYPAPGADGVARVVTHPVSVGRQDWRTPLGQTRIVAKVRNPNWYPPDSIRAEHAANGDPLPKVVPAGPDNPLGGFALRLGIPGYLIHSTNKPYGIGMRVSHGCVRMYPEDMASLFGMVTTDTRVTILNQPVKTGWLDGTLYVEVHSPLEEDTAMDAQLLDLAFARVQAAIGSRAVSVDTRALRNAVARRSGEPVPVARVDESMEPLSARAESRDPGSGS